MCCQLWFLSQINSAKQEQDVLASVPGTRWVLAVPPGEPGKGEAPLSQAEFSPDGFALSQLQEPQHPLSSTSEPY